MRQRRFPTVTKLPAIPEPGARSSRSLEPQGSCLALINWEQLVWAARGPSVPMVPGPPSSSVLTVAQGARGSRRAGVVPRGSARVQGADALPKSLFLGAVQLWWSFSLCPPSVQAICPQPCHLPPSKAEGRQQFAAQWNG